MPPAAQAGCVKLGGGPQPYYVEGWFCATSACASGFCAGATLGGEGRCGATANGITTAISNGRAWVLEGSPSGRDSPIRHVPNPG